MRENWQRILRYYNEPEITRAKLTDGWLHTGDLLCKIVPPLPLNDAGKIDRGVVRRR